MWNLKNIKFSRIQAEDRSTDMKLFYSRSTSYISGLCMHNVVYVYK